MRGLMQRKIWLSGTISRRMRGLYCTQNITVALVCCLLCSRFPVNSLHSLVFRLFFVQMLFFRQSCLNFANFVVFGILCSFFVHFSGFIHKYKIVCCLLCVFFCCDFSFRLSVCFACRGSHLMFASALGSIHFRINGLGDVRDFSSLIYDMRE